MVRPGDHLEHRRREQLGDVRRAVCDLPAAAQLHIVVHVPVRGELPCAVVARGGVVVRIAVAGVHLEVLHHRHIAHDGHQQLAVDLLHADRAACLGGVELAGDHRDDVGGLHAAVRQVFVRGGAAVGTGREAHGAGRQVEQRALHVHLDLLLLELLVQLGVGIDDVDAVLRHCRAQERVQAAGAMGQHAEASVVEILSGAIVGQRDQRLVRGRVDEADVLGGRGRVAAAGEQVVGPVPESKPTADAGQQLIGLVGGLQAALRQVGEVVVEVPVGIRSQRRCRRRGAAVEQRGQLRRNREGLRVGAAADEWAVQAIGAARGVRRVGIAVGEQRRRVDAGAIRNGHAPLVARRHVVAEARGHLVLVEARLRIGLDVIGHLQVHAREQRIARQRHLQGATGAVGGQRARAGVRIRDHILRVRIQPALIAGRQRARHPTLRQREQRRGIGGGSAVEVERAGVRDVARGQPQRRQPAIHRGLRRGAAGRGIGDVAGNAGDESGEIQELRGGELRVGQCRLEKRHILADDVVALCIADADHGIAAVVGKIGAEQRADRRLLPVTALGDAGLRIERQALEVAPEAEVHDARNRIGAIGGSGTAGDHLDGLDGCGRDGVQVHHHAGIGRLRATPVEQHQRTVGTKPAQVRGGDAGTGARRHRDRAGVAELVLSGHELRQLVQRLLHAHLGGGLQRLDTERDDGTVGVVVAPHDARTGDHHFIELGVGLRGVLPMGHGWRGQRGTNRRRNEECRTRKRGRTANRTHRDHGAPLVFQLRIASARRRQSLPSQFNPPCVPTVKRSEHSTAPCDDL